MNTGELSADWRLFADWCTSVGAVSLPAQPATVSQFFVTVPAAPSTARRRRQVIRAVHDAHGSPSPLDPPRHHHAGIVRSGPGWLTAPEALGLLPTTGWLSGFVGRRDGALLSAAGCGVVKGQVESLTLADAQFGPTRIRGTVVVTAARGAECAACAVHRWVEAYVTYLRRGRAATAEWVDEQTPASRHVCDDARTFPDEFAGAPLLPSIDRHGWVSDQGLSRRAVPQLIAARQQASPGRLDAVYEHAGVVTDRATPVVLPLPRRDDEDSEGMGGLLPVRRVSVDPDGDLDTKLARLDAGADAMIARMEAILAEDTAIATRHQQPHGGDASLSEA